VRAGCEVVEVRDENDALMNDFTGRVKREEWKPPQGPQRTLLVALDPAAVPSSMWKAEREGRGRRPRRPPGGAQAPVPGVYRSFNILMRRKAKENNFKAVLESIRDLMNEEASAPRWLHDLFLGYGDPGAASWHNMPRAGAIPAAYH